MKFLSRVCAWFAPKRHENSMLKLRASGRHAERVIIDLAEIDPLAAKCALLVIRGDGVIFNCTFMVPPGFTIRAERRSDGRALIHMEAE